MKQGTKPDEPFQVLGGRATSRRYARENAEVRAKVAAMKAAGMTFEEIGRALQMSRQRAHAIYHRHIA
jgi:hypothetical protein